MYSKINIVEQGATAGSDIHSLLTSLIANNPSKMIVIPSGTFYVSKPLYLDDNTCLQIDGVLKLIDGTVADLTEDMLIGEDKVYIASPSDFKVGQRVSLSSDTMPEAGGGDPLGTRHRVGANCDIIAIGSDYIQLSESLAATHSGVSFGDMLVSDNAKVGHNQNVLIADSKDAIRITGSGDIDGSIASQYDVEAVAMEESYIYGEDLRGGSGYLFNDCTNIWIQNVNVKDNILHGHSFFDTDGVILNNIKGNGAGDKNLIFYNVTYVEGVGVEMNNAVNEEGITFYSNVDQVNLKNISCSNNPRYGIGGFADITNAKLRNVTLNDNYINVYLNTKSTGTKNSFIDFDNIALSGGISSILLHNVSDINFNDLTIADDIGNASINILGMVEDVAVNGGSINGTTGSSEDGIGVLFSESLAADTFDARNITFNEFDLQTLKKAIQIDEAGITSIEFDTCTIDTNTSNGDTCDALLTRTNCTIDPACV